MTGMGQNVHNRWKAVLGSVALGVILVGAGPWIPWGLPAVDRGLHRSVGSTLGKQALSLVGSGGRVLILTRDTETFAQPALDATVSALRQELDRGGVTAVSELKLQVDPLRPAEVPSGDFFDQIRKAKEGDVIVSLLGPPFLDEEQWKRLGKIKPKMVALCSGNLVRTVDLRRFFEAGHLHAGVVSHPASFGGGQDGTKTVVPASFDQLYLAVGAGNLAKLPVY